MLSLPGNPQVLCLQLAEEQNPPRFVTVWVGPSRCRYLLRLGAKVRGVGE
jgi:hypothetical protein